MAAAAVPNNGVPPRLGIWQRWAVAVVCLLAGVAPLAARWLPDDRAIVGWGVAFTADFAALTVLARRAALRHPDRFAAADPDRFAAAIAEIDRKLQERLDDLHRTRERIGQLNGGDRHLA